MDRMRKNLAFAAAGVTLLSLAFPHWAALMAARTYPRPLCVHIYPYMMVGDAAEWNIVGKLEGVGIPPIPHALFILMTVSICAAALLSIVAAFKQEWLRIVALAQWLLMVALAAGTQYNLYVAGHTFAADRALRHFKPFTPPFLGWVTMSRTVATYQVPATGSALMLLAAVLLTLAVVLQRKGERLAAHDVLDRVLLALGVLPRKGANQAA